MNTKVPLHSDHVCKLALGSLFCLALSACPPPEEVCTTEVDTEAETGDDTASALDRVILSEPETVYSELQSALHILAMDNGEVIIAESREAPETTGRLAVFRTDGTLADLVTDIPLVHFTHDVRYLGPNGFTRVPDTDELLFAVFLGAGDVVPVEPGPNWDPDAGSIIYRVPIFDDSGDWLPPKAASELEIWASAPHAFIYDITWSPAGRLVATEPGENAIYLFEPGTPTLVVSIPLEDIPIDPVDDQETVEAVPTGIDMWNGLPLVGHLGGGLKDDDGNPTGQAFDQSVGRVTRLEGDVPVVVADGLPSVMDVVTLDSGQVLLICWDYYMHITEGYIFEMLSDGTTVELARLTEFPVSASASSDALYVADLQGNLVRYELGFLPAEANP